MARCKRCGLKTALGEQDIEIMLEQLRGSGMKLVDNETYEKRLKICMECEKLEYGSTCMLCGAVVQARCLMERGKCPFPKAAKWC
jgi:hypothetical protein